MKHFKLISYQTVILISLCVLIILARIHTYHEPFERDIGIYAVIAHEMLNGHELYSDLWDIKPPAVYATFALAEILVGYGSQSIFLLNIITAIISLLGIYVAGASISKSRSGGLWAATCWAIVSSDLMLQANQPNVEVFVNAFLIWIFVLLIKYEEQPSFNKIFTIGLLLAISSLYKHITVVAALAFCLIYLYRANWHTFKNAFFHSTFIMLIGISLWGSVFFYFIFTGRFEDFYEIVFQFNREYVKLGAENSDNFILNLLKAFPIHFTSIVPLFILSIFGIIISLLRNARIGFYLLAYFLSVPIMVALPNKFFPHYYQLWLPILSIAGGIAIIELGKVFIAVNKDWGHLNKLIGIVLLTSLLSFQIPSFYLSVNEWSYKKYGSTFIESKRVAALLNKLLLPEETFYQFGAESTLYFYSQRNLPSGIFFYYPLILHPLFIEKYTQRVIRDLEKHQPELVVFGLSLINEQQYTQELNFFKDHPLILWMLSHYHPIPEKLPSALWVKNNGNLENRLKN